MRRSRKWGIALFSVSALCLSGALTGSEAKPAARKYAPLIDPAQFTTGVDNPYYPLVPGTRFIYHETKEGKTCVNEVTVLAETKLIMGVTCTVVHDVVRDGDRVKEDTYDWFAQDKQGDVWYFGEDTKEFLPKGVVSTEGSWTAGVKGAQPGIMMPGRPAPSAAYRQEYLAGEAEDMGQIVRLGESVHVPLGSFSDCIRTKEWSMLEAGTDNKWYAKGIGLVRAVSASKEVLELISVTQP